jgi:hypothetical protein
MITPSADLDFVSLLQTPRQDSYNNGDDAVDRWMLSNVRISDPVANDYTGCNLTNLAMRKHYEETVLDKNGYEKLVARFPYADEPYANDSDRDNALSDYINKGLFHLANATGIYLNVATVGANLSALTAGEIEVSFLISKLP